MRRYFSIVQMSKVQYKQQKRMTALLVGQGSLPLLIPAIMACILSTSISGMMHGQPPSKLVWDLTLCTVMLYPVLSPILTVALTKPYYTPLTNILRIIAFKREASLSIIKF